MDAGQPPTGTANPYSPPKAALDPAAARSIEAAGFKSARGLANAIAIVLGVDALVQLGADAHELVTIGVMGRVIAREDVEKSVLTAIDVRTVALAVLSASLGLAAVVLFCLFMPRANRNARSFRAPLNNSPGWAAGWFFVPIAFWWKPYQAMKEIWQGSDPDPTVPAFNVKAPALIKWWWAMYLLHNIGAQIVWRTNKASPTPEDLIASGWTEIITSTFSIAAAILAGAVVRALARRQDERQRRERAGAPAQVTAGVAP